MILISLFAVSCAQPVFHTVKFNTNGGSSVPDQSVEDGKCATQPEKPTYEGYTFEGWYSNQDLTQEYDFNTPVKADITIYAKWKLIPVKVYYTVSFASLGGTSVPDQIVEAGQCATEPDKPRKSGYKFKGWYEERTYKTLYDFNTPVNADLKLYAKWVSSSPTPPTPTEPAYLTFSVSSETVSVTPSSKWNATTKEYNNGSGWQAYTGGVISGSTVMFRGLGGSVGSATSESDYEKWEINGTNVSCSGNIETILDYGTVKSGGHPTMDPCCYAFMLSECTSLITAPVLPATTLAGGCYEGMFYGCTSLNTLPSNMLPAETLTEGCYCQMFQNCTSLLTTPVLPAETLAVSCYSSMFSGCTALTSAPVLSAENLADECYNKMFEGCSNLLIKNNNTSGSGTEFFTCPSTIPSDAVTDMFKDTAGSYTNDPTAGTYYYDAQPDYLTFTAEQGATVSVTPSSKWNATTKEYNNGSGWQAYTGGVISGSTVMFRGLVGTVGSATGTKDSECWTILGTNVSCSGNIETILDYQKVASGIHPSMGEYCYYNMFAGQQIITTPNLPATDLVASCYRGMFYGCTGIAELPTDLLPATTLANNCYYNMFYGCTGLTALPTNLLPATTLADSCYFGMFSNCTELTELPTNLLPVTTLANSCYYNMFSGCTGLTELPTKLLPATTLATSCYYQMFKDCTSLTLAPELPAKTLAGGCYDSMFLGCSSLATSPELPATTLAASCYYQMFSGCASLTSAPELSATTLAASCYMSMFQGCTSLETAPALPATTLVNFCYKAMFYNCTSLKVQENGTELQTKIFTCPPTSGLTQPVQSMFSGTVRSFTGNPIAGYTYYYYD